jgi:hypothetical protein
MLCVGRLIHSFFRHGHSLPKADLELVWPVEGVPVVNILQAGVMTSRPCFLSVGIVTNPLEPRLVYFGCLFPIDVLLWINAGKRMWFKNYHIR